MPQLKINEAVYVQFPMVKHAAGIGWTEVPPEDAIAKRGGTAGMLFHDEVESALAKFNPWMRADTIQQVIEKLEALPPTIEGNRDMLGWLRGERQWHDESENLHRRVRLIDFDAPHNNVFHVTWELKLTPPARQKGNQADVMFVINGVPVAIVEHKNPKSSDAFEQGVIQLRRYEKETPELIAVPQLFNVTHLIEYWYGATWSTTRRSMARWKEEQDETYRFAVQSFFEPTDFLRTLRDWILFHVEDGETRKSVLRQHQRRAIDRILDRCEESGRRRGLVWHTQGSGKTFTLLTAARLILENKARFENATVIVVVDRLELEGQLQGWAERLLGEMQQQDIPVSRADSRGELQEFLQTGKRGLILAMIHKFEGIEKDANIRENIYVFIDEAHRSIARDLGSFLMAAVPNATIIGFTGTPVNRTAQGTGTFAIFGTDDEMGYLDKYSIAESIEDETTLPIRYSMAPSDMTAPTKLLDKEFLQFAAAEGVTDINELNKVLDRAVDLSAFLTADDRIKKVAAFVAQHFREKVEPRGYKAFLVGINREACAKYKYALDKLLPPEWTEAVYTRNVDDVEVRPLVAKLQLSPENEASARLMFKKAGENPKILIVTDKLLTGYDASLLYCMYLDKPMRNHVLLQAIARVNRPHAEPDGEQKNVGLIVDFVGVLRELEKALQFDSEDVSGAIEDLDVLMEDLLARIEKSKTDYLDFNDKGSPDRRLEKLVYERFAKPEERKKFFEDYKYIERLWEILSPSPELYDHIDIFNSLAKLYATVRNAFARRTGFTADLAKKTRRLVQESTTQKGLDSMNEPITFTIEALEALRKDPGSDNRKIFNLARGLRKEIADDPDAAPILRPLLERADRILDDIEKQKKKGIGAMDEFRKLLQERESNEAALEESELSRQAFAVHLRLKENVFFATNGLDTIDLAREAEMIFRRFPDAVVNDEDRRKLRGALYKPLLNLDPEDAQTSVNIILNTLLGTTDDSNVP